MKARQQKYKKKKKKKIDKLKCFFPYIENRGHSFTDISWNIKHSLINDIWLWDDLIRHTNNEANIILIEL